jgi:flavodoxin
MEERIILRNMAPRYTRRDVLKGLVGLALATGALPLTSLAAVAADSSRKILIAYFSHTGNTRTVAGMIHAAVGGDMFEIQAAEPYPSEHSATERRARKEWEDNARPALAVTFPADMSAYDTIFIGYPNWFRTTPMIVRSFLEQFGFAGKTLVPFCTHGGNGLADSPRDIAQSCPQATLVEGFAVRGSRAAKAQDDVLAWLQEKNFLTR